MGRVTVLDQMQARTHDDRHDEDEQTRHYLPTTNASMLAQCYNASIGVVGVTVPVEVGK